MNPLIYVISIVIVICILYHLRENIKNLWGVREGFSETISGYREDGYRGQQNKTISGRKCQKWTSQTPHRHSRTPSKYPNKGLGDHNYCRNPDHESGGIWCYTNASNKRWEYCDPLTNSQKQNLNKKVDLIGKNLGQSGRCANYKVNGAWVRDGVYSNGGSLEDCANRFGEEGGVFSYNSNSKGCLYTKTSEPHTESGHYPNYSKIKGITSGCKPEGWGGGWKFYKAEKKPAPRPSLRQPRQAITKYSTFTGNCMPSSTLMVIGKTPQKPKKGHILQNVRNWAGKWDNFVMSFVIKPLGTGSGWRNIMHNTFDGANGNYANYSRWPGIWMHSGSTRLHIRWTGNQGIDPTGQKLPPNGLPENKKSRVTLIINGAKYTCIIRDENDDIMYEKSETLRSGHSPPNKPWGDGSTLPLLDYGGSMERMPTGQPKLGECEGDCDRNSDCQTGLKCFQRSSSNNLVPGCAKGGSGDIGSHDYCYYDPPNKHSFYMSDPWYEPFNCEISELILDSNISQPTCKLLEKQTRPTGQNAFYFACERKTFMEHHLSAIAMGGHLASIHNAEENEAIRKIIPPCGSVWIGAVRKRPGSGNSAEKWTWTDGSNWDYANWRSGEPNDCCKGQTENRGEVHAEIQKKDGKWNDIMHKYNNDVKKFAAVYKLNAKYENSWPAGIVRLNTDGMNSWSASKKLCEGEANSGNVIGAHGTVASRREVLDFIKGKPESGDSWTPVSDGPNVWLQVGMRNDRSGITPSFAMTHQEIPDVAYTKSGEAGKPSWGTSNTKRTYRKSLFCKKPPDGMTWDNNLEKFVKAKIPDQISSTGKQLPSAITNQRQLPSAITTRKHNSGEKTLAVGNDHKFKPGQTIVIGIPPNTETRTIVKA